MKNILFFFILCFVFFSCSEEPKKEDVSTEIIVSTTPREDGMTDYFIRKDKNDTIGFWKTVKGEVEVITEITPKGLKVSTKYKKHQRIIDLGKLDTIYQQPKIEWISDELVCVHTFVNGKTGNIFFIPYISNKRISFFNKEIIKSYPAKNTLLYIDEINGPDVTYTAYNVKTKQSVSIVAEVTENGAKYPYYKKINFKGMQVIFEMSNPKKEYILDISDLLK
jgi:hypothetical protein